MLTQRRIYEFGDFRVDTGRFLLIRAGNTNHITPTVFRILVILLERAGQVVPKDQLMQFVWPDSFVEEGNLNRNVSTLRQALEEKPGDHRYIETVPKAGYRFIAPVRSMDYQAPTGSLRKAVNETSHHLTGRESERTALHTAYESAKRGRGGIVGVSGDAGIGKTALLDSFIGSLLEEGESFHLARGVCSEPLTESEPFMPWIESLGDLARESTVNQIMEKAAPTWLREISHAGSGAPNRMKRELLDFCREVSAFHPLIVFIDDFHWADVGSVDLLAFLATRLESVRALIIVCYRPAEMKIKRHPFLQVRSRLLSRRACTEIRPGFLDRVHIEELLAREYASGKFPKDYAEFLRARTEGNPLFIRELLHSRKGLSEHILNMIQTRLDQLDDTSRQLLVTASVQGREFDSAVLAASMQVKSEDVEDALDDLAEIHELIQKVREEELPDGKFTVRYRFVYRFYQEACYASLAPTRKASLNASLAEAFLTYYGN
jgi:predicted ATPase